MQSNELMERALQLQLNVLGFQHLSICRFLDHRIQFIQIVLEVLHERAQKDANSEEHDVNGDAYAAHIGYLDRFNDRRE